MKKTFNIAGTEIQRGESKEIRFKVSESYIAIPTYIPVTVIRGEKKGPKVFITAAVHGDELNGIEIVRRLIYTMEAKHLCGTLICIPVVNIFGFQNSSRYLPDGSDLNRVFPGNPKGNFAERYTYTIYEHIIRKCEYGIDLHTAAVGRSNLPHIRADIANTDVERMAKAFGTTIIKNEPGSMGSLRRAATDLKIPTILFEAGEIRKFELAVAERGLAGVLNVLSELGMVQHRRAAPPFQEIVDSSKWIRAGRGGLLSIQIRPGELIYKGDEIAFNTNPFGKEVEVIKAPFDGIVIGIATDPTVTPGQAVCHMVELDENIKGIEKILNKIAFNKK